MSNIKRTLIVALILTSKVVCQEGTSAYNAKNDPFINTTLKTEQEIFGHARSFFFNTSCPFAKGAQRLHVAAQALEDESKKLTQTNEDLEKLQRRISAKIEANKREIKLVNSLEQQATLMKNTLVKADDYADQVKRDTRLAGEKAKGGRGHYFGELSLKACQDEELFAQNTEDAEKLVAYFQARFHRSPYPLAKGMELINTIRTSLHKEICKLEKKIEHKSLVQSKTTLAKQQDLALELLNKANNLANKLAQQEAYKKQAHEFYGA